MWIVTDDERTGGYIVKKDNDIRQSYTLDDAKKAEDLAKLLNLHNPKAGSAKLKQILKLVK